MQPTLIYHPSNSMHLAISVEWRVEDIHLRIQKVILLTISESGLVHNTHPWDDYKLPVEGPQVFYGCLRGMWTPTTSMGSKSSIEGHSP